MTVPGRLVSLLTFPGIIVHQLAHQFFCRVARLAVMDICYFRLGDPAGFVVHEDAKRYSHQIMMALGPFLACSLVGTLLCAPAAIPTIRFRSPSGVDLLLIWLGVSIAMHAFPSVEEARTLWRSISDPDTPVTVRLLGGPIVGTLYLGALGSYCCLNAIWALFLAAVLPNLVVSVLARP
jgi:hypothetical protein